MVHIGTLTDGPGTYVNVSLSWPSQLQGNQDPENSTALTRDRRLMYNMYHWASIKAFLGFINKQTEFRDPFYVRTLIAFHEDPTSRSSPLLYAREGNDISTFCEHLFVSLLGFLLFSRLR